MTPNAEIEKDLFEKIETHYREMEHERAEIVGNLAYVQGALDYHRKSGSICDEEDAKLQQYLTDAIRFLRTVRL